MPTIRELVVEAEENFATGRHSNSFALFKTASIQTLEKSVLSDGLYLAYRTLHDAQKSEKSNLEQLKFVNEIHKLLLRFMVTSATQSLSNDDLNSDQRVEILDLQQKAMESLHMDEERASIIQTLFKEYHKLFENSMDKQYLIRSLKLKFDIQTLTTLLDVVFLEAEDQASEGQFDGDLVAASLLIQHLEYIPIEFHNPANCSDDLKLKLTAFNQLLRRIISGEFFEQERSKDVNHILDRYDQRWILEF